MVLTSELFLFYFDDTDDHKTKIPSEEENLNFSDFFKCKHSFIFYV